MQKLIWTALSLDRKTSVSLVAVNVGTCWVASLPLIFQPVVRSERSAPPPSHTHPNRDYAPVLAPWDRHLDTPGNCVVFHHRHRSENAATLVDTTQRCPSLRGNGVGSTASALSHWSDRVAKCTGSEQPNILCDSAGKRRAVRQRGLPSKKKIRNVERTVKTNRRDETPNRIHRHVGPRSKIPVTSVGAFVARVRILRWYCDRAACANSNTA